MDKVLSEVKALLPDHAVVEEIRDVISPDRVESQESLRAVDMLHVVNALYGAFVGPYNEWADSQPKRRKW